MTSLDLILQVEKSIANLTDPELALSDLSLTNCDREPIHIQNAIQLAVALALSSKLMMLSLLNLRMLTKVELIITLASEINLTGVCLIF